MYPALFSCGSHLYHLILNILRQIIITKAYALHPAQAGPIYPVVVGMGFVIERRLDPDTSATVLYIIRLRTHTVVHILFTAVIPMGADAFPFCVTDSANCFYISFIQVGEAALRAQVGFYVAELLRIFIERKFSVFVFC